MKQRVEFSTFCIITTLACLALFVGCTFIIPEIWWQIGWGAFTSILLIICLCYMPMSIGADENAIYDVKLVKLCPPTMGAIRVCGSGGFFGHWGWFRERDLGKYFAYYGKASDCFLVELKNGHKYILGCKNAPEMVEYIAKQIKK